MKKLFTVIRQGRLDEVTRILDKNPDLISCLAKAPPKKDDGQSPLMVAIKSDNLEVAHLLLDRGADVNFADAVNPYGSNFSAHIWDDAICQCFMRTGHTVGPGPERSKGYFLMRRLLDMGMNPNQKTSSDYTAWQHTLKKYDQFVHGSLYDPVEFPKGYEREMKENRRLRKMLKAVLDELQKHGADIHAFAPPNKDGLPSVAVILRNLEEGRELGPVSRGVSRGRAPDNAKIEVKKTYGWYKTNKKRILSLPSNQCHCVGWGDHFVYRHILLCDQSRHSLSGSVVRAADTICSQYGDWGNIGKGRLSDFHMRRNCPPSF